MKNVISLFKPLGQTPLQCIEQFRNDNPEYKNIKMCYAGRLDPMADGLLLVLTGDECQKRNEYERLPKTYEFDVLFGIETDTYDSLGVVTKICDPVETNCNVSIQSTAPLHNTIILQKRIQSILTTFIGTHNQPYPPYSSARVDGKPLFWWAREGRLNEIEIPSKQIEIYDLKIINKTRKDALQCISFETFQKEAIRRTTLVNGQFRQEEIAESWRDFSSALRDEQCSSSIKYPLISFHISCSSGTYVRSIAHEMGTQLGLGAIAWRITRTGVGDYRLTL